jgi:hypothetical protein
MALFRFRTAALVGRWHTTRQEALVDALRAGQARRLPSGEDAIELKEFVRLEEQEEPLQRSMM